VVAFKGADPPTEGVTRDKAAAEARAKELLAKVQAGTDIGALAHSDSDAPASAARGGYFATFKRAEWPPMHAAIRDAVYTLTVGQTAASVVAAPYGYAVLQRCPVEKAHSRHILIRYKGAKRADASIKRSKAEAEAKAKEILKQLAAGADFATIAGNVSEDSSRDRGGDIGLQPRGNLAPAFEQALFALKPGERSGIVETEMGFHIIERVPD
jgi:parvulin-like peptidyl-prolyl isomerase